VDVVVQLSPEAASVLQGGSSPTAETQEITAAMRNIGVYLRPLHPLSGDPVLDTYFWVRAPEETTARGVVEALQRCKAVKAAYIKPPEGPP
jgi:hypothetical protein